MQILQRKNLFLLIFAIILCIYPLCTTAVIRTLTHDEEKDFSPLTPRMQRIKVYDDGTAVAKIARVNLDKTDYVNRVCFLETLSLRIIHLDGTVDEKDIDLEKLGIPSINYCFLVVDEVLVRFLDYFLIRKNHILITYVNTTNPEDITTYEDWGMIIDFDGNEYSRTYFAPTYIDIDTNKFVPGSSDPGLSITLNVNREKGFLRTYSVRGKTRQEWQQYKIESDGTFTMLTSAEVPLFDTLVGILDSSFIAIIATVDEGYAILTGNTINNFTTANPLLPQAQLSILPIKYNQTSASSLTLYQSSLPNLIFDGLGCGIAFAGIGQTCILTVSQIDPDGLAPDKNFFVKIDFLSSGSTTNVTIINNIVPATAELFLQWEVRSLHFGGFLLTNPVLSTTSDGDSILTVYGYLYNGVGGDPIEWEFIEPLPGNAEGVLEILPNNTLLVTQFEVGNSWSVLAIDLPRFAGEDNEYDNLNVETTSPAVNAFVNPEKITEISINFTNSVDLSNGKLSIYQVVNKDGQQIFSNPPNQSSPTYQVVNDQIFILRQSVPARECSIENEGKTVRMNVLNSTFSVSNGNYFITIDNEFVKEKTYDEPLLGIRDNVWNIVREEKEETFAPGTTGLMRLTSNGTEAFDKLSQEGKLNFFSTLLDELAIAVPVNRSRLTSNNRTQQVKDSKKTQHLISVGIGQTRDSYEISVASIITLIDNMIKHKDQSPIGLGQVTAYLDESFGFEQFPNLWETYKTRLIGLIVIAFLFAALFILAQIRTRKIENRESRNMAIFQLGIILFDLTIDIFFVSTNAQDLPELYIPSVVFLTLPIAINTILAFYIITQENTKPKFYKWFAKNGNIASIFILLAGADIEALDILQSNLADLQYFQAPFSKPAKSKIFWGAFLNIFTEDIPQVIIQIYYRSNSVTYDIIPLLALISSSVNLTINIVGRLYHATNRLRRLNVKNYNTPNDTDDFGGLNSVEKGEKDEKDAK